MHEPRPPGILLSAEQIQKRVAELAQAIRRDAPDNLHLVAVLKGAFMFVADLVRYLSGPVSVDFMVVSSYGGGTTSPGDIRLVKDIGAPLDGKHVVIVEDIVDTGVTLVRLQRILLERNPSSLKTVCLLSKAARRQVDVTVDYIGFPIDDRFVVGYGMDYAEQYRHLPHVAILDL
ncbi:MAG: hypoxanthine phosphoribosyltransferase [Vicinamibacterales bacterium]